MTGRLDSLEFVNLLHKRLDPLFIHKIVTERYPLGDNVVQDDFAGGGFNQGAVDTHLDLCMDVHLFVGDRVQHLFRGAESSAFPLFSN